MPRVPNNQGLTNFLDFENMEALDKSQPLSFIISSDAEPPHESKFHMSSEIQENPPRTCLPINYIYITLTNIITINLIYYI